MKTPESFTTDKDFGEKIENLMQDKPKPTLSIEENLKIIEDYSAYAKEKHKRIEKCTVTSSKKPSNGLFRIMDSDKSMTVITNYIETLSILNGEKEAFDRLLDITQKHVKEIYETKKDYLEDFIKEDILEITNKASKVGNKFWNMIDTIEQLQIEASEQMVTLAKAYMKNKEER